MIKNKSGVCRIAITWRARNSINKQCVEIVVASKRIAYNVGGRRAIR